ncbi:DMT family transporter [Ignatzschineria rhizosphaerae]|uniref:DMT family transporter n=1 Tax=Ignatzschineria rhizosphaerae TaxID=2923279 RepID=A0ABY3X380_9GAMM|nr:DMT family transporter [Ignatzschineria rhizosphaerae]UNM96355.1 DMT family transporter [Ignatzschineria rhizosphaerae]
MKIVMYLLALIAGTALSVEGAIYAELGKNIGQLESSLYNFVVGSVILGLLVLFAGKGNIGKITKLPKWMLMGGVLGTIYLTIIIILAPRLGLAITMIGVVAGQLLASMLIEHHGWLGSSIVRVNRYHVIALTALAAALLLLI